MRTKQSMYLELGECLEAVNQRTEELTKAKFAARFWKKDPSLWKKEEGEEMMMGWLDSVSSMREIIPEIRQFRSDIINSGFNHIVLLGMGGSSLSAYVFRELFRPTLGPVRFTILDTTEPEIIRKVKEEMNIATLFIVSSKSGTTVEVNALRNFFFSSMKMLKNEKAGENFVTITDPGSPLIQISRDHGYRKIFLNASDIGGRFSALSLFGLVPAALMGVDIEKLLTKAEIMLRSCNSRVRPENNPGIQLGVALAELALSGKDKLTYIFQPELEIFGLWLEQLIAESTGKKNTGIFPVNSDPLYELDLYGKDTAFLHFSYRDHSTDLKKIGSRFPFISILIDEPYDIGMEFIRWEIATATAGAILGVDPFDQPDVEETKKCTAELLGEVSLTGKLPAMEISLVQQGIRYYSSQKAGNAKLLMENFFDPSRQKDFAVVQCYLPETPEILEQLSQIKYELMHKLRIPISIQFGPRYLHSSGQYHKGGPNNGFFLQLVSSSEEELQIPGYDYTFGALKRSQAFGDREALIRLNRNVILADLGTDPVSNLAIVGNVIREMEIMESRTKKNIYAYNEFEKVFEVTPALITEEKIIQPFRQ